jgi:phage-related protein
MGAAFSFVRDSVIGATAETERYRVTLGTMIGDQEKANKIIHDLDYSPVSDFYGTANAIGGLQGMVTFGMQAEEASEMLTRLGDIAQGNSEAFVSMSNNLGQVFAKGKADATDLKQFVMQGFDVVGVVAQQSGKSREAIEKAGVTYEQTAGALKALTSEGGKYNGMLAKQMNTLGGVIKQFASFKAATAEAIGTGISDNLKDLLKYILEIGRAGQEAFAGKFVAAINEVIHWVWQIIIMWKVLGYRIADMGDMLSPVKSFFSDLRDVAGNVLTGMMNLVVSLGQVFLHAFKTAYAFIGPVLRELGGLVQKAFEFVSEGVQGAIPVLRRLQAPLAVVGAILGVIIKGLGVMIDFLKPFAPIIGAIATAVGVATAALWLFNIAAAANPIGLTIAAIVAGVGLIVGLVKVVIDNWDKISAFFVKLGKGIAATFMWTVKKIVSAFTWAINKIKGAFSPLISWIKSAWSAVSGWFDRLWEGIVSVAINVWNALGGWIASFVEGIKAVWSAISGWFSGLWEGIVSVAMAVWNTLKDWFIGFIEGIQSIWNTVIGFFSGLWETIKQGPAEAIEYIRNAFFGLFTAIQEKLFAFINRIKEGWETVKGFFGGIADGVVNFFTGGDSGGGQLQPAYAGGSGAAMAGTIGPTSNYAYTSMGGGSTVNAHTSINVNVPPGTSQEQSEAITRQIDAQFNERLAGSINSSRADIPSPEIRRR